MFAKHAKKCPTMSIAHNSCIIALWATSTVNSTPPVLVPVLEAPVLVAPVLVAPVLVAPVQYATSCRTLLLALGLPIPVVLALVLLALVLPAPVLVAPVLPVPVLLLQIHWC